MEDKRLKPQFVADMLDVSVATLQRWDNENKLKAHRTGTNRRYYLLSEIETFKEQYCGDK